MRRLASDESELRVGPVALALLISIAAAVPASCRHAETGTGLRDTGLCPAAEGEFGTYGCIAIISGHANYDVTVKGKDIAVELRFHAIWAKRNGAVQFVSWQATRVPPKQ